MQDLCLPSSDESLAYPWDAALGGLAGFIDEHEPPVSQDKQVGTHQPPEEAVQVELIKDTR